MSISQGGAISNLYAVIVARHALFPEYKTLGLKALPQLVLFTSAHVRPPMWPMMNIDYNSCNLYKLINQSIHYFLIIAESLFHSRCRRYLRFRNQQRNRSAVRWSRSNDSGRIGASGPWITATRGASLLRQLHLRNHRAGRIRSDQSDCRHLWQVRIVVAHRRKQNDLNWLAWNPKIDAHQNPYWYRLRGEEDVCCRPHIASSWMESNDRVPSPGIRTSWWAPCFNVAPFTFANRWVLLV